MNIAVAGGRSTSFVPTQQGVGTSLHHDSTPFRDTLQIDEKIGSRMYEVRNRARIWLNYANGVGYAMESIGGKPVNEDYNVASVEFEKVEGLWRWSVISEVLDSFVD